MSSVNLPASLYDMFQSINDRINRLELGYNGPQASADAASAQAVGAQSLALQSYSVATNASLQASNAAVQAVQAQSQATIASTQATYAVTTANGKNTVAYGTSAPPSGTHTTGDLYFQFNGSNQVTAQYTWNGSSWVSNPITSTVIASINAGTITSGTITGIEYNNGTGTFHVTPAGALTASSANITGTIVATAGYIGNTSGGSYWSITSSGITGYGSANITGGLISGSAINIGSGTFQVDSAGNLNASSATITGTIHASLGDVGGFTIGSTYLSSGVNFYLNASTGDAKLNSVSIGSAGTYYLNSSGALSASTVTTSSSLSVGTNAFISGQTELAGNLQVDAVAAVASPTSTNFDTLLYNKTGTAGTQYRVYRVNNLSSAQYKDNITYFPDKNYTSIVSQMKPITFTYKPDQVEDPQTIVMGLLAEDIDAIDGAKELVDYLDEKPNAIRYEKIPLFMIKAISEINDRLTKLEGK